MALSKELIHRLAGLAFSVADGLTTSGVLKSNSSTYNETSGVVSTASTATPVKIILSSYHDREVDGTRVWATDIKALILASTVASKPVPTQDTVVIDAVSFQIVSVDPDPVNATYTLQLRGM